MSYTDAQRIDWLMRHDGRYYNIDRITALVGKGFASERLDQLKFTFDLREAIDRAMTADSSPLPDQHSISGEKR